MKAVNVWMAATNVAALPAITNPSAPAWYRTLVAAAACASVCMHLTETKHGLTGFAPAWATTCLNVDRVFAVVLGLTVLTSGIFANWNLLSLGAAGVMFMLISELPHASVLVYVVFHTAWHCIAYAVCYLLVIHT
jgi:hypothetical protein